ncbi:MAG: sugar transporter ATP-binding protein [Chloroflexi bacterium]|nr:sugar transporter ATP-binding protein [Chloroflexota bacterium]
MRALNVDSRSDASIRLLEAAQQGKTGRKFIGKAVALLVMSIGALCFLAPVFWMLSTSLKTLNQTLAFPPVWIPTTLQFKNYPDALTSLPFGTFARNSAIVSLTILVGEVVTNSFVAFGFARLRGPGRRWLFIVLLSTMLIPFPVLVIPQYVLFKNLGWIDTFLPLIVPPWFGSAFLIFLVRQFYMTIPRELDEAAEIDGCGYFSIYFRIIVPLSKPVLASVAIFSFTYNWNDYLAPLIYLNSPDHFTLPLGLASFIGRPGTVIPWHQLMAASLVTVLPCVLLFFFAQRFFIQGIVVSGVKG